MARANRSLPPEVEQYLCVAKLDDILFKQLQPGSNYLATRVQNTIHVGRRNFSTQYGVPIDVGEVEDKAYLQGLEPTAWKDQDHYAVLGLGKLRFRATEDDIRSAYRQRCLKHHPDKRQAAGEVINPDGDYFACIVKAFEILGTPKRSSWDSVDPEFDNYIPSKEFTSNELFFSKYGAWFELNSRWSTIQPVPLLGGMNMPRVAVEEFYSFWYEFDSWREYSYLDEEDKEKGQDREERRWIEKQNKVERAKKKKEEMVRIRGVVDNAYAIDPRIQKFKDNDNKMRLEKKLARQALIQSKQLEEEKLKTEAEEKARLKREKEEAEAKERDLILKKEKDMAKRLMKKERKTFRTLCKGFGYFSEDQKTKLENMTNSENLIENLEISELERLNLKLQDLCIENARTTFLESVRTLEEKIQREKADTTKPTLCKPTSNGSEIRAWTPDEQKMLEQALKQYSPSVPDRWDRIAARIPGRTKKDCMTRFKELAAIFKAKKSVTSIPTA